MSASLEIVSVNGAKTVEIRRDGCPKARIRIASRAVPGMQSRDYFVTCRGKEPTGCHMILRARAPVVEGRPPPAGAIPYCSGDCPEEDEEDCKLVSFMANEDPPISLHVCRCTRRPRSKKTKARL
jgi:hypothetical protein